MDNERELKGHFFVRVPKPARDHAARLRPVAEGFCDAYGRKYNRDAKLISLEVNEVDAVVCVGGDEAAVEFASYHIRDDCFEQEVRESDIRSSIEAAADGTTLSRADINLEWRTESVCNPERSLASRRMALPSRNEQAGFVRQLLELGTVAIQNWNGQRLIIRKVRGLGPIELQYGWATADAVRFDAIAKYCDSVTFTQITHGFLPTIRTIFDARFTGVDAAELQRVTQQKLDKLRMHYRDRAGGRKVWLVIHADGFPMSCRVPPSCRPQALELIRSTLAATDVRFDRVWWAEYLASGASGSLFEVG